MTGAFRPRGECTESALSRCIALVHLWVSFLLRLTHSDSRCAGGSRITGIHLSSLLGPLATRGHRMLLSVSPETRSVSGRDVVCVSSDSCCAGLAVPVPIVRGGPCSACQASHSSAGSAGLLRLLSGSRALCGSSPLRGVLRRASRGSLSVLFGPCRAILTCQGLNRQGHFVNTPRLEVLN